MTGLTHEIINQLRAPFPVEDHELRDGGRDGKLVYITEEPLVDRLSDVDPDWTFTIVRLDRTDYGGIKADLAICHAELTICGITRAGVGMNIANIKTREWDKVTSKYVDLPEPIIYPLGEMEVKGAATDALKRCARLFGVGAYLLKTKEEKFKSMADFTAWYNRQFQTHTQPPEDRRVTHDSPPPSPSDRPMVDDWRIPARIAKLIEWAEGTVWTGTAATDARAHTINRIANALKLDGTPDGKFEALVAMIQAQYTGDDKQAARDIQMYEPKTPPSDKLIPDEVEPDTAVGLCKDCGKQTTSRTLTGEFQCELCRADLLGKHRKPASELA